MDTLAEMFLPENMVYLCEFKKLYTLGVWSEAAFSILDLGVSTGAFSANGLAFFATLAPPAAGGCTAVASLLSSATG